MKTRKDNREGSVRKIKKDSYECVIQSKYYNLNGNLKRIKRRGKTEEEARKNAKRALADFEKNYMAQIRITQNPNTIIYNKNKLVKEYMEYYIDNVIKASITASTYLIYNKTLKSMFYNYNIAKLPISCLDDLVIQEYFDLLFESYEESSAKKGIRLFKSFFKWLYKNDIVDKNYMNSVFLNSEIKDEYFKDKENDNTKKIYSYEDIRKIYKAYKENYSVFMPIYILMLETMMRISEVLAITFDDIDLENRYIYVRSATAARYVNNDKNNKIETYIKVTKNRFSRKVYLSDLAVEAIEKMLYNVEMYCPNNPNNLLFPHYKTGENKKRAAVEYDFVKLCKTLEIDRGGCIKKSGKKFGLNVHALRHTAISIANSAIGANVVNTALMAGHRAITTENVYTHPTDESLKSIRTVSKEILGYNENIYDKLIDNEEEAKKLLEYLKNKYES